MSIDIGAGTEDVLLYDDSRIVENCIKMVLPSPTLVYASKAEELTGKKQNIIVGGDIIGGSAITAALKKHLASGLKVAMTEKAAMTIRNNLDEVRSMGIETVKDESELSKHSGTLISFEEINATKITKFLSELGTNPQDIDVVAVAVQDHGAQPPGESNRRFRMRKMQELLEKNPHMEALAFEEAEVPECFMRMRSALDACKKQLPNATPVVMDTALSAVLGCLEDPVVVKSHRILAVNVGNGHTLAALVQDERVLGLMEHHTEMLRYKPKKLERLLRDFAKGNIKGEDVFKDGGHGAFYLKARAGGVQQFSSRRVGIFAVTGPNRSVMTETRIPIHFAAPAGDVMMTGTMGLVRAVLRKLA
ncbi:MAG: DUF1786 family protein [Promethearchaeati archaeon SRVP18_Atabeyarchaeia-1]